MITSRTDKWFAAGLYLLTIVVGIGLLAGIIWWGEYRLGSRVIGGQPVPVDGGGVAGQVVPEKASSVDVLHHVLLTLAVVMMLGGILARLLRWAGQPPVIAEVVAGICLGPSVLGALSPQLMHGLIPGPDVDPHGRVTAAMQAIAQLGILLYMFVVGLELDAGELRQRARAAVTISHFGILVPFVLGALCSLWLYRAYAPPEVSFTGFAMFVGVAMSITAFPVLARILTDRGLASTPMGALALTCAAADDVTAWCLLALVVGMIRSQVDMAIWVVCGTVTFVVVMVWGVRPWAARWCAHWDTLPGPVSPGVMLVGLLSVLLAALTTEWIGIHAIFGSFMLGAVVPHDSRLAVELRNRLRDAVTIVMLPAFFALTGMRTQIGLLSSGWDWLACLLVIGMATAGKFGGTWVAARLSGVGARESAALGALMNTRGLMELIVLNIGLDLGVISERLFAMMVLMALVTTVAAAPIVARLYPVNRPELL
ncbi:MAG: cation:proton antiporter [Pirellulales bacterium]